MDHALDICPLFETPQPPREGDLTKDVEHEELDPGKEVQLDTLVRKPLVQADKEVSHRRRHERLEREQVGNRVQIRNGPSHPPMHVLVAGGEDVGDLAALHPRHDGVVKLGLWESILEPIDLVDGPGLGDHDGIGSEAHHGAISTVQIGVYLMGVTGRDPMPADKVSESCERWAGDVP